MTDTQLIKSKYKSGIKWSTLNNTLIIIIQTIVGIILARLIDPSQFGLLGMILVFINFAHVIRDIGLNHALIQKANVSKTEYSTVFWTNLFLGIVFTVTFYFGASFIANIYENQKLIALTKLLSFSFLFASMSSIFRTIYFIKLDFRTLTIIDVLSIVLSSIAAIILAILGFGAWALVWQILIGNIITFIIFIVITDWYPSLIINISTIKQLFPFGSIITLNTIFDSVKLNIDNFIIGKLSGEYNLGIYNRAFGLMRLPITNLTNSIRKVMFPTLSKLKSEIKEIQNVYIRSTRIVAFFALPLMLGMWAVSQPFILGIYGENWEKTIPILRVFSILGAIQSLNSFTGTIFNSLGYPHIPLYLKIINIPLTIIGLIYGFMYYNIMGIVYVLFFLNTSFVFINIFLANRLIKLRNIDFFKHFTTPTICSIIMASIVELLRHITPLNRVQNIIQLAILVITGILIYTILVFASKSEILSDIFNHMFPSLKKYKLIKKYFKWI